MSLKQEPKEPARLARDRYPQLSFFIADMTGCAPKADRHSMEHPMFILSKNSPDKSVIEYEYNDTTIRITPSGAGFATIWDKDILIYAVSQLMDAINKGRETSRTIRITSYDLMVATNRGTSGRDYEALNAALVRLRGTTITTNIISGGRKRGRGFGLIDEWDIVEKDGSGRMIAIDITLSKWLYSAVTGKEVLTLNRDYFRLTGGLERRIYELSRKHCGNQAIWSIGLDNLHKKSGSLSSTREFKRMLKAIISADCIPDYHLELDVQQKNLLVTQKCG